MAYEGNDNDSSARPVRLAGRGTGSSASTAPRATAPAPQVPDAPAPDASQNPDFTGVGAPHVRTTGDRAPFSGGQAAGIRRGVDDGLIAGAAEQRRAHSPREERGARPAPTGSSRRDHHVHGDGKASAHPDNRVSGRSGSRGLRMPDLHIRTLRPASGHKGPARIGESLRDVCASRQSSDLKLSRVRIAVLSAIVCLLFVFLGSLAFHGTAGIDPKAEFKLIDEPLKPTINFSFSTPRNRWRAGEVPHIYQTDPLWAEKSYAGGTIRKNACGPTCLTMVYVYKTGKTDMTPVEMCKLAEDGNYAPTGATEWSFMLYGAASLGLDATQLQVDRDNLEDSLKAGDIVIASVRPGTFTNVGHYIVLHGIDDTGHVTVYDPNSEARSLRKWGIVEVLDEVNALWAY